MAEFLQIPVQSDQSPGSSLRCDISQGSIDSCQGYPVPEKLSPLQCSIFVENVKWRHDAQVIQGTENDLLARFATGRAQVSVTEVSGQGV